MKVEIWSDVVCPWCYIGKRRFESALERFGPRDGIEVEFRSFELDPNAQTDDGTGLDERLARKYGFGLEQARMLNQRVVNAAAGEGLHYRLDIARHGNTMDSHRLIHLAAAEGLQGEMKERLMAAYFTEGKSIGDHDSLLQLAVEVGIDADRAREVLAGNEFADEVRSDEREANELGITGVPFFVINRRYGVSGAQAPQVLLSALEMAWNEAHPAEAKPAEAGA
jgi:predicted DsbA family dithiol-disulfide isomerase